MTAACDFPAAHSHNLLLQEVLAALQDCQQVVCLEDIFEDSQWVYIVQELCEGGDLAQALAVSSSPPYLPSLCTLDVSLVQVQMSLRCRIIYECMPAIRILSLYARPIPFTASLASCVTLWHAFLAVIMPNYLFASSKSDTSLGRCTKQFWPHAHILPSSSNCFDRWLCAGQTHGACTESQASAVIYEVMKVIATCHAEGLLHGDIKPGMCSTFHAANDCRSTDQKPSLKFFALPKSTSHAQSRKCWAAQKNQRKFSNAEHLDKAHHWGPGAASWSHLVPDGNMGQSSGDRSYHGSIAVGD